MDFGILVEGVVELEPITGRLVLRIQQQDGSNVFLDVQEQLEKYKGEEVRFILTPLKTVAELARMVESGEVPIDEIPALKKH
jgi:hypothetical protein